MSSITVSNLGKVYNPSPPLLQFLVRTPITQQIVALDDVSFTVGPGEVCAMVGPNGAGKTTAFRVLVGLTTADTGTVNVMGLDPGPDSLDVRRIVGWMPTEDRSLLMRLSGIENLRFHGRLQGFSGAGLESRIVEALDLVGLGAAGADSVFAMSAGMRARLQLARAILHEPSILVLDEPTASIDPVASYELIETIVKVVSERKIAALVSSHRLDEIEALGSHVVLLDKGKVRYDGDLKELRATFDRPHIRITVEDPRRTAPLGGVLDSVEGCSVVDMADDVIECVLDEGTTAGKVLHAIGDDVVDVRNVERLQTPLREVLAEMYRVKGRDL